MKDETFNNLMRGICLANDIELIEKSDGWLLELRKNGVSHRIIGANFDLNDQVSYLICRDKVAVSAIIRMNGISVIEHRLLKSRGSDELDIDLLARMISHGDVVIKPLEGSGGAHVYRTDDTDHTIEIMRRTDISAWAISPYVDIKKELRLVVVDGAVWLAHEKTDPVIRGGLKFFNLSKGANAKPLAVDKLDEALKELAVSTSSAIGTRLAAIDIAITANETASVLEVNSSFSLTRYAHMNKATSREVASFYDKLVKYLFAK